MSFSRVMILCKRELKEYFYSPLIYILSGFFILITGYLFYVYLISSKEYTSATLLTTVLRPLFGNMNFLFLFLAPLITMRSFSEEKKQGTLDLLLISRLTDWEIVTAKFISSFMVASFMLLTTLIFPLILAYSGYSEWSVVLTSYLGLLFSIGCYLSVGLFASTLSENQIVSAIIGFSILFGVTLLVVTSTATNNIIVSQLLSYMSVPFHFENFVRGVMKNYNFLYFVSFIFFFSFLTRRSLDSRNW